jgi:hypothetical protein
MLRLMLDAHPMLAIPGESNFIRFRWAARRTYRSGGRFVPERLLEDILADDNVRAWGIPADEVRDLVRSLESPSFGDVIAAPFRVYARKHAKPRWGDKTPIYVLSMPMLADLFPHAKFVHLIRDGRDVALSYLSIPMFTGGIWSASKRWRDWVTAGVDSGTSLGSDRYMEVRYEALVSRPESELRKVCAFLRLGFDPRMLRFYAQADRRLEEASPQWVPFQTKVSLPPQVSVRDWKMQMSRRDVEIFESVAGPLLAELGYERAVPKVPLGTLIQARVNTTMRSAHVRGSKVKQAAVRSLSNLSGG